MTASGAAITLFDEENIPPPLETFGLFARADVRRPRDLASSEGSHLSPSV